MLALRITHFDFRTACGYTSENILKARFDDCFTSEIRNMIATKKPQRLPDGFYITTGTRAVTSTPLCSNHWARHLF
jgi:hypothetical protein